MQTKNFDGFKYQLGALYLTDSNEAMVLVDVDYHLNRPFIFKYPKCSENQTFQSATADAIEIPAGKKEMLEILLEEKNWYMCEYNNGSLRVTAPLLWANGGYTDGILLISQSEAEVEVLYKLTKSEDVKYV